MVGFDGNIWLSCRAERYVKKYITATNTFVNVGADLGIADLKHLSFAATLDGNIISVGRNYFGQITFQNDYSTSRLLPKVAGRAGVTLPNGDVLMCPFGTGTRMIRLVSSYPKIYNFEGTIPSNLADLPTSNYNVLHNRLT